MTLKEAPPSLSVEEARDRIVSVCSLLDAEFVPLAEALERTVAGDIVADESLPPFPNSAMDGYAVRASDTAGATATTPVSLTIIGEVAAGAPVIEGSLEGAAIRIFTGAEIPPQADAVIPQEWVERRGNGSIEVQQAVTEHGFVRPAGRDVSSGRVVTQRGEVVTPGHIALLAALGHATIQVTRKPRIAVLTTGNELLPVEAPLSPGKIRNSNGPMLAAQLRDFGAEVVDLGVAQDSLHALTEKLDELSAFDAVLSSGGVSVGDYDLVRQVLGGTGTVDFWRVHIKPGRPLAFGSLHGKPFIGLPGNPASSFVCAEQFVRPAVWTMLGRREMSRPSVQATIDTDVRNADGRQTYLRVRVKWEGNGFLAQLAGSQDSSALSSLADANALLVIPAGVTEITSGTVCQVEILAPFGRRHG